jgi:hypothetical protein
MGQLMVIAVEVDDGTIRQSFVDKDGKIAVDDTKPPRIIGCLESEDFDRWAESMKKQNKMKLPRAHNHYQHLYAPGTSPSHVGVILHTHNSPGQVCVIFNGVPVCFP